MNSVIIRTGYKKYLLYRVNIRFVNLLAVNIEDQKHQPQGIICIEVDENNPQKIVKINCPHFLLMRDYEALKLLGFDFSEFKRQI